MPNHPDPAGYIYSRLKGKALNIIGQWRTGTAQTSQTWNATALLAELHLQFGDQASHAAAEEKLLTMRQDGWEINQYAREWQHYAAISKASTNWGWEQQRRIFHKGLDSRFQKAMLAVPRRENWTAYLTDLRTIQDALNEMRNNKLFLSPSASNKDPPTSPDTMDWQQTAALRPCSSHNLASSAKQRAQDQGGLLKKGEAPPPKFISKPEFLYRKGQGLCNRCGKVKWEEHTR